MPIYFQQVKKPIPCPCIKIDIEQIDSVQHLTHGMTHTLPSSEPCVGSGLSEGPGCLKICRANVKQECISTCHVENWSKGGLPFLLNDSIEELSKG